MGTRVVAIPGSLRAGSYNRKLLDAAVKEARRAGATVDVVDLKALALPVYDGDVEEQRMPEAATALAERIAAADVLLVATPEYNGGMPGGLKNAIDWASRPQGGKPFKGKVAGVLGATTGMGGTAQSQAHLRQVLARLGVWVAPTGVMLSRAQDAFDEAGALKDEKKQKEVVGLVTELLAQA